MANISNVHSHTHHLTHPGIATQQPAQGQGGGQTLHHYHHIHHFLAPSVVHLPGQAPVLVVDKWVPNPAGFTYAGPPMVLWSLPNHPNAHATQPQQPQQQQPQPQGAPLQLVDSGPTPPPTP